MSTTNPHPLDAAARDELARKAEAAKARAHEGWYLGGEHICTSGAGAIGDFIAACSPDVILALLASVRGAEADTRDALADAFTECHVAMLAYGFAAQDDDAAAQTTAERRHYAALHALCDAARAHPPIQETDDAESR